jgi:hypothetical protein
LLIFGMGPPVSGLSPRVIVRLPVVPRKQAGPLAL